METLNKVFEYRGFKFNIKLELNTKIEKRIDGDRWHTVTTNCMDSNNFYTKNEVKDENLEQCIKEIQNNAKIYVDKQLGGPTDIQRFINLGFS